MVEMPDRSGGADALRILDAGCTREGEPFPFGDGIFLTFEKLEDRGLVPPPGPNRAFYCRTCKGGGVDAREASAGIFSLCGNCRGRGTTKSPTNYMDLLSWATLGRDQIDRAEGLVREVSARLAPWGILPCTRVVWRIDGVDLWDHNRHYRSGWPVGPQCVLDSSVLKAPHTGPDIGDFARARIRAEGRGVPVHTAWWAAWVEMWPPNDPRKCPHEPMLALRLMGLSIDSFQGGNVHLAVSPFSG